MSKPSHDEQTAAGPEELSRQVERTRAELGDTVGALAARTDVRARAQEKAAEAREQAAAKAGELRARAAGLAHQAQDKLADPVKDKAAHAAEGARVKAARAGKLWEEKAPDPIRRTTALGLRLVRGNPRVLLGVAGVGAVVWLACRRKG
ncbi:DUF3618 domain-containing protein [Streptomyces sp. NPDC026672]|uniref:DUF3618 domain-containing protein n=1 Tax=unclassified Streptomyces TaxID=2593676 RepID=UPI0033EC489B